MNVTALKDLSAPLRAKIEARPTETHLISEDPTASAELLSVLKLPKYGEDSARLPPHFDGRKTWRGLLTPVRNQGSCGSCWAFASTTTLADRFNIQAVGLMHVELSAAKLILCDWKGLELRLDHPEIPDQELSAKKDIMRQEAQTGACFGNSLVDACRYLYQIGTPTEECVPYNKSYGSAQDFQKLGAFKSSQSAGQLPLCSKLAGPLGDMCAGYGLDQRTGEETGVPERFYRCLHYYGLYGTQNLKHGNHHGKQANEGQVQKNAGEWQIRDEIWIWGPVASAFKVYPDFYTFDPKNEVYEWDGKGLQVGGHAIEIVGWGETDKKQYWIIRNSWGTKWGDGGYFRMVRGKDNCELESNCIALVPDYFYPLGFELTRTDIGKGQAAPQTQRGRFAALAALTGGPMTKERTVIAEDITTTAGGIDPTTGYTRRVMAKMPWVNFKRPVALDDLPNWGHFIAAKDASVANRKKYQNALREKNSDIRYSSQTQQIYITMVVLLGLSLLAILILLLVRSLQKK